MIKTTREFIENGSRYQLDGTLTSAKGWAQCDTAQDASYFGIWTNPRARKIVSFCEGDLTVQEAETDTEYTQMVTDAAKFYVNNGHGFRIDDMSNPDLRNALISAGAAAFLYAEPAT